MVYDANTDIRTAVNNKLY